MVMVILFVDNVFVIQYGTCAHNVTVYGLYFLCLGLATDVNVIVMILFYQQGDVRKYKSHTKVYNLPCTYATCSYNQSSPYLFVVDSHPGRLK